MQKKIARDQDEDNKDKKDDRMGAGNWWKIGTSRTVLFLGVEDVTSLL